jgi:hypothetical protein
MKIATMSMTNGASRIHILTTMTAMIANPNPRPFRNTESVADIAEATLTKNRKNSPLQNREGDFIWRHRPPYIDDSMNIKNNFNGGSL